MAAHIPVRQGAPQLCPSCAAMLARNARHTCGRVRKTLGGVFGGVFEAAKASIRVVAYAAVCVALAYAGWFLYEEFFDCLWTAGQSFAYMSLSLLASAGALLAVCKDEFTVDPRVLYE